MIKKIFLFVTATLVITILIPTGIASAHVLKTDGDIGVVLHINPDDNPVSGQATQYELSFQQATRQFRLAQCLCRITFLKDSTVLATNTLAATSDQVSEDTYIFPKAGVYTLRVTGEPKQPGDFQKFSLDYIVRVSGDGATSQQDFPPMLWLGIGLAMGLILLSTVPAMYADGSAVTVKKEKK